MARRATYRYYAVVKGEVPGIYQEWDGGNGVWAQVDGFSNADYVGCYSKEEAIKYYKEKTGGEEPVLRFLEPKYEYYAVVIGKEPGIYKDWYGMYGAHEQLLGVKGHRHKGFYTLQDAKVWYVEETCRQPELRFSNEQE